VRGWFWLIAGCVWFGAPLLLWQPTRLLGLDALVTAAGFLFAGALGAALSLISTGAIRTRVLRVERT
jgi:hypothetical protein